MMPTAEFKRALNIMKRIMLLFPEGHRFVLHRGYLPTAAPDLVLRTDASGVWGNGAGGLNITTREMFCVQWTQEEFDLAIRLVGASSTHLEALAAFKALELYIRPGLVISLETDCDNLVTLREGLV
jgi:hypothetical protein